MNGSHIQSLILRNFTEIEIANTFLYPISRIRAIKHWKFEFRICIILLNIFCCSARCKVEDASLPLLAVRHICCNQRLAVGRQHVELWSVAAGFRWRRSLRQRIARRRFLHRPRHAGAILSLIVTTAGIAKELHPSSARCSHERQPS
ncbi:unnamed protein product [Cuscuta campestris]|uniref:Uncharacterized protein n=1 Tax=Cuscuta campestris TaxID=132261 RepID=A0A484MDM9_9ASTE|nr:unnamed protein product [Cuscuta campestris]